MKKRMADLSTVRTFVLTARHLGDVASNIWRILRSLFQEVVGFTFFVFAALGAFWLFRHVREFRGEGETLFKIVLVSVFVVAMAGFGFSSFRHARRISRSR